MDWKKGASKTASRAKSEIRQVNRHLLCFRLNPLQWKCTDKQSIGGEILMSHVQIGQLVPDFTLPSSEGGMRSLHDFQGSKLVIYFYPKDMTPGCTQESCDFRDFNGEFAKLNTKVIGISPDDLKKHGKFIEKHELPFPLLSDEDHTVSEMFGVWVLKKMYGREYMGIERSTFLLDENGKLMKEWRKVKVNGHVEEVLQAVKEAE
ncbi:peroxiredoxin-like protein [Paenibacillus larvae subsp. larvae B-3650]|nr:peroxiredoxin-like protein [Paenibacillus larvae subsp. larvae B-3650]